MSRTPARVTQADVARALRAARQVGVSVCVDILPDGTIRLLPASGEVKPFSGAVTPQVAKRKAPDL